VDSQRRQDDEDREAGDVGFHGEMRCKFRLTCCPPHG
jgi:hypothetical protein